MTASMKNPISNPGDGVDLATAQPALPQYLLPIHKEYRLRVQRLYLASARDYGNITLRDFQYEQKPEATTSHDIAPSHAS